MPELTSQQKLFESLYRGKSAAKPANVQQQSLNNALKKPSVSNFQKTQGAKPSSSAARASTFRAYRAKVQADVARFGKETATAGNKFRANSAQNISKFGGGVKSRFGPTINAAKTVAAKNGARVSTLGRLLGNSRFLAGANSVPGLALGTAAYVIWKHNLELLAGIYGVNTQPLSRLNPFHRDKISEGSPPPFTGGQSPGVRYVISVFADRYNYFGQLADVNREFARVDRYGKLGRVYLTRTVTAQGYSLPSIVIEGFDGNGVRNDWVNPIGDIYDNFVLKQVTVSRIDGQPDTGGDPPGGEGEYSQGGTNTTNITNVTNVTNITNPAKDTTIVNNIPSAQVINNYYADSANEPKAEPVPTVIPQVVPSLLDNTDKEPESPTDSPPVKTEDLAANDTSKKPKAGGSITIQRYPRSQQELDEIYKVIEEDRKKNSIKITPLTEEEDVVIDRGWYSFKPNLFLRNAAKEAGLDVEELPSTRITKNPQARRITSIPTVEKTNTDAGTETGTGVTTKVNEPKTPEPTPTKVETSSFPTPTAIATAVGGLDILRQIKDKPIPTPTCLAPVYVPPVGAQAKANGAAIATLQGVTIAQNAVLQKTANVINTATKATVEAVTHKDYGLKKIQKFADTAWKATHADKAINALALAASLHNAAMLSRNLGETLGDLTSQALSTIGIKDSEGSSLDINAALGKSFNSLMTSILGAEVYQGVKETWNKSSRIISSASSIIWTVRSIADSAREVTEWTAENTGKIGNALKRFRVVGENAYKWMPEKVTATNKWMLKVDKLKEGGGSLDDAASSFSSVLGEVQNIQQESSELKAQGDKFQQNIKDLEPKEQENNRPVKDARKIQLIVSKAPSDQADVFRGEGETE